MGSMTVRRLDDAVIRDVRISAAKRGVSMEQEARDRLGQPLPDATDGEPSVAQEPEIQARIERMLAFGRDLPRMDFDSKEAFDELYDYLDEE